MEIILNFLISYIAGNLPTLKDYFVSHQSIEKVIRKCFNNAIEKWSVIDEIKESTKDSYEDLLKELNDYLTHSIRGRHSKQNELLILWANEIRNDPVASSFVTQIQQELDLEISQDIKNLINSLKQEQHTIKDELEKISQIINPFREEGIKTINDYWAYWATGDKFILHSDLVLAERKEKTNDIISSSFIPGVYEVGASSVSEAIAFVCASLLLSNEYNFNNAYVITKESTYDRIIATDPRGLIIITDLNVNHNVVSSKGNVVFHCKLKKGNGLPELSPEAFAKAIEKSLSHNIESYNIARQGGYDVISLRRILGLENNKPSWFSQQNIQIIIFMAILGEWDEAFNGDKEIIESFSKLKYDDFIFKINSLLNVDNSPIIKIGTIWKIKSPLDLFSLILNEITDFHLENLQKIIQYLSIDNDPEVIEKLEETKFRFHTNKQMFSNSLKHGIYRSMAILADIYENEDTSKAFKLKRIIEDEFLKYDLSQYLSNRHYINYMAAINPKSFLNFFIKDIKCGGKVLDELFKGRQKELSLIGYDINYQELIHALESIALNKHYLFEVTFILFYAMKYPKVGNYVDSVRELLGKIYQFGFPQTEATFDERLEILISLKESNPNEVFWVICHMLESLTSFHTFTYSHGFSTKLYRRRKDYENPSIENIDKIISLIPCIFQPLTVNYLKCIEIASQKNINNIRNFLINFLLNNSQNFKKNIQVVDELDKIIKHHEQFSKANWAFTSEELLQFKTIYNQICDDDILLKNRQYFTHILPIHSEPYSHSKFIEYENNYNQLRGVKIKEIIDKYGINFVWSFSRTVENPKSIFEGLATLHDLNITDCVYEALVNNKINVLNAKIYFSCLYYKMDNSHYLKIIDKLLKIDKSKISVPLYAPGWIENLANKAQLLGKSTFKDYWKNVQIWIKPPLSHIPKIIKNLLESKREWDIISFIVAENHLNIIELDIKIKILKGAIFNLKGKNRNRDFYDYKNLLLSIQDEEIKDTPIEKEVLEIEGLLFHTLNEYLEPGEELHIIRALKWDVDLLISLLKSYNSLNNSESLIGIELLYKFVNNVNFRICQYPNGIIDNECVISYISKLINCEDLPFRFTLIGNLLFSIMKLHDVPSKEFCSIIETLSNDDVDQHLYLAISNSRGCTWRGCYDGGQQERNIAEKYACLSRKVLPYSYRMKKIFDDLSKSYLLQAERMDEEALMNKYR